MTTEEIEKLFNARKSVRGKVKDLIDAWWYSGFEISRDGYHSKITEQDVREKYMDCNAHIDITDKSDYGDFGEPITWLDYYLVVEINNE